LFIAEDATTEKFKKEEKCGCPLAFQNLQPI
jgi:hypothetical protein